MPLPRALGTTTLLWVPTKWRQVPFAGTIHGLHLPGSTGCTPACALSGVPCHPEKKTASIQTASSPRAKRTKGSPRELLRDAPTYKQRALKTAVGHCFPCSHKVRKTSKVKHRNHSQLKGQERVSLKEQTNTEFKKEVMKTLKKLQIDVNSNALEKGTRSSMEKPRKLRPFIFRDES